VQRFYFGRKGGGRSQSEEHLWPELEKKTELKKERNRKTGNCDRSCRISQGGEEEKSNRPAGVSYMDNGEVLGRGEVTKRGGVTCILSVLPGGKREGKRGRPDRVETLERSKREEELKRATLLVL